MYDELIQAEIERHEIDPVIHISLRSWKRLRKILNLPSPGTSFLRGLQAMAKRSIVGKFGLLLVVTQVIGMQAKRSFR